MTEVSATTRPMVRRAVFRVVAAIFIASATWGLVRVAMTRWHSAVAPQGPDGSPLVVQATVTARESGSVVRVRLQEGPRGGEVLDAAVQPHKARYAAPGRRCLVRVSESDDGRTAATFCGPVREGRLLALLAVVAAVAVLALGGAGVRTLVVVALGSVLVMGVLLPLVVNGLSPILCAAGIAVPIAVGGLLVVGGVNLKSASAVIGCCAAVLLAAWLPQIASNLLSLTGLEVGFGRYSHLDVALWYSEGLARVDFADLLIAGMILSGLGATMDVSMCVSAAVFASEKRDKPLPAARLFHLGAGVGRDVLGMMAITVVLAVVGTQFDMLVLNRLAGSVDVMLAVANREEVAGQVVRVLCSVAALGLSVPLTACAAAVVRSLNDRRA